MNEDEISEVIERVISDMDERKKLNLNRDDNLEILRMIISRMGVGIERYGHGLRAFDDTRQWGTDVDSWAEMALEEVLDMTVYLAMEIIRIQRHRNAVKELQGNVPTHTKAEPHRASKSPKTGDDEC